MVRGAIAGALATFVALFFHALGGGETPTLLGLTLALVAAMWVSILLVGRALSAWRLIAPVAISQVLFHTLFSFSAATAAPHTDLHSVNASHVHSGAIFSVESLSAAGSGINVHALTASPTMWASHVVAIALTVALLYRGERMLQALGTLAERALAWLQARLGIMPSPAAIRAVPTPPLWAATTRVPRRPELAPLLRRGPPVRTA